MLALIEVFVIPVSVMPEQRRTRILSAQHGGNPVRPRRLQPAQLPLLGQSEHCGGAGPDAVRISPKGFGGADNKLIQAHIKADHHNPTGPDAAGSTATSFCSV